VVPRTRKHTSTHTCLHAHTHTQAHACTCTHTHARTHKCTHSHTHTHAHARRWCWGPSACARSSALRTASSPRTTRAPPSRSLSTCTARACARACSPPTSCPMASRRTCECAGEGWGWGTWRGGTRLRPGVVTQTRHELDGAQIPKPQILRGRGANGPCQSHPPPGDPRHVAVPPPLTLPHITYNGGAAQTHTHIHTHARTHTRTHTYRHTYTYRHTTHTHIHTHTHIPPLCPPGTTTAARCRMRWRWTLCSRPPAPLRCRRRCSRPCPWRTCSI